MSSVAAQILIRGIVQGVGYRAWAIRVARELGVKGWVRNLDDGRVEVWAEGEARIVDALEARCARGPAYAEVTEVVRREKTPQGHLDFDAAPTAEGEFTSSPPARRR